MTHTIQHSELFEGILQSMPIIVFVLDKHGTFLFSRGAALQSLGLQDHEVVGSHYQTLYANFPKIRQQIERGLRGEAFNDKTQIDGHFFQVFYRPSSNQQIIGIALEETELVTAQTHSEKLVQQLVTAYEITHEGMWTWNLRSNQIEHNQRWRDIFGYNTAESCQNLSDFSDRVLKDDLPLVWRNVEAAIQTGDPFENYYAIQTPEGIKHLRDRGQVIQWSPDGDPLIMTGSISDMTQQVNTQQKLEKLAFFDDLTGLSSQLGSKHFWTELSAQNQPINAYFLILDIDNFQLINNALGHQFGNQILKTIGHLLQQIFPSNVHCSRVNEDEFLLIAPNLSSSAFQGFISKFKQALQAVSFEEQPYLAVQFSYGQSTYPQHGLEFNDLFRRAETALFQAKKLGKNCLVHFDLAQETQLIQKFNVLGRLKLAIENRQLHYQVQPQFHLARQKFIGAEVLMRWQDPLLGLVSPAEFIPIAEESQLLIPMTYWLIDKVIFDLSQLQQTLHRPVHFAINIPSQFLEEPKLSDWIIEKCQTHNIQPNQLELEITESQLLQSNAPEWENNLLQLRQFGIEFSVDDFGTGYSNLSQLKNLDFSKLKIDKSFVDALDNPTDINGHSLMQAMIGLAKTLNLQIVAEGVETFEQVQWLQQQACEFIQGYYYSKPLDLEAFVALHQTDPQP